MGVRISPGVPFSKEFVMTFQFLGLLVIGVTLACWAFDNVGYRRGYKDALKDLGED